MLRDCMKLTAIIDIFEFENKKLIEAFKDEKQKKNMDKMLNLLGDKNKRPQIFLPLHVQAARESVAEKKAENERHKKNVEKKEEEQQKKNM